MKTRGSVARLSKRLHYDNLSRHKDNFGLDLSKKVGVVKVFTMTAFDNYH